MGLRGRGGFGNYYQSASAPVVQATSAPVQHIASPSYRFHTGRGGFGNTAAASQMSFTTPDEYISEVKRADTEPQRYMIGRGGLGNHINRHGPQAAVAPMHSSSSTESTDSNKVSPFVSSPGSGSSSLWARVRPSWTR